MAAGVLDYTREADEDLFQIHEWLERISEQVAKRTILQIDSECRKIAEMPGIGTRCDHIRAGMRKWIFRKYLIFYEVKAEGVLVVRILHGRRDLRTAFPSR